MMAISLYIFEGVIANHTRTTKALTKNAKNSINKTKNTNRTTKTRAAKQEHSNPDNVMATKKMGKGKNSPTKPNCGRRINGQCYLQYFGLLKAVSDTDKLIKSYYHWKNIWTKKSYR